MQLRFICSDESTAILDVEASEKVEAVTIRLLATLEKRNVTANWLFLGSPLSPTATISDTPLIDGCTVNVFLRAFNGENRPTAQVPADYAAKTDQLLLRVFFVASFVVFACASFARSKYPEAFTPFSTVALNVFWSLWAVALAANWRSDY